MPCHGACNATQRAGRRQIVAHSALRRFSAVHCRPKAPWALLAAMATPMGLELEAFITRSQLRKRCMDSQCAAGQGDAKVHSKTHRAPYGRSQGPIGGPWRCGFCCTVASYWQAFWWKSHVLLHGVVWGRFGIDLGSIWGSVWGQDRFGVTLGSIWAQFGVHLGDLGVFAQMRKEMWLSWTGFVSARTNNSTPAPGPAPSAIANHTPSAFARRPPSASNADARVAFNALLTEITPDLNFTMANGPA